MLFEKVLNAILRPVVAGVVFDRVEFVPVVKLAAISEAVELFPIELIDEFDEVGIDAIADVFELLLPPSNPPKLRGVGGVEELFDIVLTIKAAGSFNELEASVFEELKPVCRCEGPTELVDAPATWLAAEA